MNISEQVNELRKYSELCLQYGNERRAKELLKEAADTIESLSAKLEAANIERSDRYYGGGWIPVSVRPPKQKRCIDSETGEYWRSDNVLCSCFDEQKEEYDIWIDYTVDGYWQAHERQEEENLAWISLPEPFRSEGAKERNEKQYDKIMCVNAYLIEKYGSKLWEEFGIEKTGDTFKDMPSILAIFDEIYKKQKEKYPLMWYEYCLCGNGNLE